MVKSGSSWIGKQKYKGKACSCQFILNPHQNKILDETKQLIEKP